MSEGRGREDLEWDVHFLACPNAPTNRALCRDGERKGRRRQRFSRDRCCVQNSGDQQVRGVRKAVGIFWAVHFLRAIGRKNLEMAEAVAAVEAVAIQFDVQIGGLREPKLLMVGTELHGSEFDGDVLAREADLVDGLEQVGFEAEHLKRAGIDPGPAGQLEWKADALDDIRAKGIEVVLFLLELDQPSWAAFPFAKTFAGEVETSREQRMKDQTMSR